MQITRFIWSIVASLLLFSNVVLGEADSKKVEKLVQELLEVESRYQNYQAEIEIAYSGANGIVEQAKIASRGKWFRWDAAAGTLLITPFRSVSVRKASDDATTFVVNRLRITEPQIESEVERMKLGVKLPFAPTSYLELSLADFFSSDEIEFVDVSTKQLNGESVWAVEAISHLQADLPLRMRWYFLDSSPMLLLRHEISNDKVPGLRRMVDISYGPIVGGVPFPEKVRSAVYNGEKETSVDFEVSLISLVPQSPPEDYFSLTQFGLDDQLGRPANQLWYVVMGAVGIVFLTAGLFRTIRRLRGN